MSPQQVLTLKTDKTDAEIQAECAEQGTLTIKPPLTRAGWSLVELAGQMPAVVVEGPDGTYIGTVQDTDDDRYEVYVELR